MAFGTSQAIPLNSGLIRPFDVLLLATIHADNRGQVFAEISSDGGNSWAWCAAASVHFYHGSDAHVSHNSICVPIHRNHLFRIKTNFTVGTPQVRAWAIEVT
jgi:hypothetical protein